MISPRIVAETEAAAFKPQAHGTKAGKTATVRAETATRVCGRPRQLPLARLPSADATSRPPMVVARASDGCPRKSESFWIRSEERRVGKECRSRGSPYP